MLIQLIPKIKTQNMCKDTMFVHYFRNKSESLHIKMLNILDSLKIQKIVYFYAKLTICFVNRFRVRVHLN